MEKKNRLKLHLELLKTRLNIAYLLQYGFNQEEIKVVIDEQMEKEKQLILELKK